jgi:hypothetical protein
MRELYKHKFLNLKRPCYCFDKKSDLEKSEKVPPKKRLSPSEKLDILLSNKEFRGEVRNILKIMKSHNIKKGPGEFEIVAKEKNVIGDLIENNSEYKPKLFDMIRIVYQVNKNNN